MASAPQTSSLPLSSKNINKINNKYYYFQNEKYNKSRKIIFTYLKDNIELSKKEIFLDDIIKQKTKTKQEEKIVELQNDLNLFNIAQIFSHKHLEQEDIDDDEEDEEEDEDYKPEEEEEEEEEENEEKYFGEEEEEEEEEEEVKFDRKKLLESLKGKPDNSIINSQSIEPFWSKVASELSQQESQFHKILFFNVFKNSCSAFVQSVIFKNIPYLSMIAKFTVNSPSPEFEDLKEIIKEGNQFIKENKKINPKFEKKKEEKEEEEEEKEKVEEEKEIEEDKIIENIFSTLKKFEKEKKEEGIEWKDDFCYDLSGSFSNGEIFENKDSFEENLKNYEWTLLGASIERLTIGKWSFGYNYRSQLKLRVDPIEKSLIYTMFELKDIPENYAKTLNDKKSIMNCLDSHFEDFKKSKVYKMKIDFKNIEKIHYHESQVDPTLVLFAIQLKNPTNNFYQSKVIKNEKENNNEFWEKTNDFSENGEASKKKIHYLLGYKNEFDNILKLMLKDQNMKNIYEKEKIENLNLDNQSQEMNINAPFPSNEKGNKTQKPTFGFM